VVERHFLAGENQPKTREQKGGPERGGMMKNAAKPALYAYFSIQKVDAPLEQADKIAK
jgi:hypothetical protein